MPPACPSPHPGHDSGTAFLSFLGHGVPACRGLGKLGPAVLQPPPVGPRRGCCATLPTKSKSKFNKSNPKSVGNTRPRLHAVLFASHPSTS